MRVLFSAAPFLYKPDSLEHLNTSANLGLYLLASIAKEAGHRVAVVDPSQCASRMDHETFISTFSNYDVIGLSTTTSIWPETLTLLERLIKLSPRPQIVIGGAHASLFDEHVLRTAAVDYVVRGEGDHTLPELLQALERGLDPAGTPGVSCLRGGGLVRGPDRPLLTESELAALPLPRYELIPPGYYKMLPVETSRGCLHRCTFCSITHPRTWRDMGADRLKKALAAAAPLLDNYLDHLVHIIDDCFLSRGRDLAALDSAFKDSESPLAMSTRISNLMDPEVLDFYARLPVKVCEVGVECGYPEGIKKVGKGITLGQAEELALALKERGIIDPVLFAYVTGFPWESRKECLATIRFAFNLARRFGGRIQLGWFMLYPGSEIYLHPERYGVDIPVSAYDQNIFDYGSEFFMKMRPRLSREDLKNIKYTVNFLQEVHKDIRVFSMI